MTEKTVSEDIKHLDQIKDIVHGNVTKQQESTRRRVKHGAPKPALELRDQVWRQNVRSQQRKDGKLEAKVLGPFTIMALQGKSVDLLGEDGTVLEVNVDYLKIARVELHQIPHEIKK